MRSNARCCARHCDGSLRAHFQAALRLLPCVHSKVDIHAFKTETATTHEWQKKLSLDCPLSCFARFRPQKTIRFTECRFVPNSLLSRRENPAAALRSGLRQLCCLHG